VFPQCPLPLADLIAPPNPRWLPLFPATPLWGYPPPLENVPPYPIPRLSVGYPHKVLKTGTLCETIPVSGPFFETAFNGAFPAFRPPHWYQGQPPKGRNKRDPRSSSPGPPGTMCPLWKTLYGPVPSCLSSQAPRAKVHEGPATLGRQVTSRQMRYGVLWPPARFLPRFNGSNVPRLNGLWDLAAPHQEFGGKGPRRHVHALLGGCAGLE